MGCIDAGATEAKALGDEVKLSKDLKDIREEAISVPSKRTENSIRKILVIVTKFLHFRARMEEMSKSIDEWDNPDANELENIVSGSAHPTVRQPFGRTMAFTLKMKQSTPPLTPDPPPPRLFCPASAK
ncbi:hypothetical protein BGZ80_002212 [Entomortierella chlamydospora]|uniref:Uncharacterized protein n=1 Tax=Entomortierella chlamydospora TaxID=101097 RepID=A0A9P6T334_9FUNG|nr:hypothetical protein BGZ80_002212 [Entomortierella chlamydospora]